MKNSSIEILPLPATARLRGTPINTMLFSFSTARSFELNTDKNVRTIRLCADKIAVLGLNFLNNSWIKIANYDVGRLVCKIFFGLKPQNIVKIALFENKYLNNQIRVENSSALYSNCEHLFVPTLEKADVSYNSSGKVIGLFRANRFVQHYKIILKIQEPLTNKIANKLHTILSTEDVAVIIDAKHLYGSSRGIRDGT
ncbi:GTP cyclohydrolase I FolE [Bizionia gelidisalsuginis]|uniref:GTP cyclohydrolase I n=1 Tax=Bizionia gelidisalsuginis TaxID=291188 RepID=A0ABY3MET8_9FLAO|nr:GTP cyclohydrolase I [Bizionia gelidisalsuginis]TYC18127.1 GTP cyclohydrolase I FolE [Bizionia gelidisalsuginis]